MQKMIRVQMSEFLISALEDGVVKREITRCSFGRPGHETPIVADGMLSNQRELLHLSHAYHNARMPFAMFFKDGCAFHEGDPNVASHGCIHLEHDDAEWLFRWAGVDPVGLNMTGPYPTPPIRAAPSPVTA